MRLFEMTDAQIDAAAERYYDRLFDRYYGTGDEEEPWERDDPDWAEVADIIDGSGWHAIADYVRDYINGDGDVMLEIIQSGVLDFAIMPEERWMLKDPDDALDLADSIISRAWDSDWLMDVIYLWMPDEHTQRMAEEVKKDADRRDDHPIREWYNDRHKYDGRDWE